VDHQRDPFIEERIEGRRHAEAMATEFCRHIEAVGESLRKDLRRIAEELPPRIDRLEVTLRAEIARSREALADLIRSTYVDLDRRVRVLEGRPPDSA
jgi:hypothetical protein